MPGLDGISQRKRGKSIAWRQSGLCRYSTWAALLFPYAIEGGELKPDCWELCPNIITKSSVTDRISSTYHSFAKDRSGWSRSCKPETRENMECSVRKQTDTYRLWRGTGDIQSSCPVPFRLTYLLPLKCSPAGCTPRAPWTAQHPGCRQEGKQRACQQGKVSLPAVTTLNDINSLHSY